MNEYKNQANLHTTKNVYWLFPEKKILKGRESMWKDRFHGIAKMK